MNLKTKIIIGIISGIIVIGVVITVIVVVIKKKNDDKDEKKQINNDNNSDKILESTYINNNQNDNDDNTNKIDNNLNSTFSITEKIAKLNNGIKMPIIGLGTWTLSNDEAEESVYVAIKTGFRLIDTAQYYGNESGVGRGVKKSIEEGIINRKIFLLLVK